jgi:hypothetical protein
MCKGRLWRRESLHRGPAGEPGGRGQLLGTPKDMPSKALEMGVCFHRGPIFGEHGRKLLS